MAGEDTGDQIGEVLYMAADGRGGHRGSEWRGIWPLMAGEDTGDQMVADGRGVDFCKYTNLFTAFSQAQRCPGLQ